VQVLQVQFAVQADPAEVGRARRWTRSRLQGCGVDLDAPLAETLVLVVSELVTNAVVHTGSPAVLRLVRVEVADTSDQPPQRGSMECDATSGRGLEMVGCLTDRWGWYPDGAGKRVWCEIEQSAAEAAPADGGAAALGLRQLLVG
jgi:hypothetical protein